MSERIYETTIIVSAPKAAADEAGTLAAVRQIYEVEGAEFLSFERWAERRLAYPIKGESAGLYLIADFKAPGDAIQRIERRVQLSEVVLRHLIIVREGAAHQRMAEQRAKAVERAAAAAAEAAESAGSRY